jgi:hypothetical protein
MFVLLLIVAFVIVSTVFVVAAGILSSRLSRQEEWVESYEEIGTTSAEALHEPTK